MKSQNEAVVQKVEELLQGDPESFLVSVKIGAGNNIKVFVDADNGMSLEKLVRYNRKLYRILEESAIFPGNDFSLEVSSPGLDEPLKLQRQYLKNVGRYVAVTRNDDTVTEGKLLEANSEEIVIEEEINIKKGKGPAKKKETKTHTIPFSEIKSTKIQIKF